MADTEPLNLPTSTALYSDIDISHSGHERDAREEVSSDVESLVSVKSVEGEYDISMLSPNDYGKKTKNSRESYENRVENPPKRIKTVHRLPEHALLNGFGTRQVCDKYSLGAGVLHARKTMRAQQNIATATNASLVLSCAKPSLRRKSVSGTVEGRVRGCTTVCNTSSSAGELVLRDNEPAAMQMQGRHYHLLTLLLLHSYKSHLTSIFKILL